MNRAYEDENLPLPLLRRSVPRPGGEAEGDNHLVQFRADRLRPGTAGALVGLLAGAAGLGVVHAMHVSRIGEGMLQLAGRLWVPADAAAPLAYLAAGVGGAIVGAG